ncbi:interferon lambda receptor 1 [Xenentodon cancila]
MRTRGVAWFKTPMGMCVILVQLIKGSTGLVCHTSVESLDLGCLLRWDCPHASPNTTYTVQTKTQGDAWQDVPWCVWMSSRSCDVSRVFSNFELYNMIRLGVHASPNSTLWMKPHKFDYSDFTFSPPSISVSWRDECLSVKVHFPCVANRRCSHDGCCPISKLIDPWTTVTVYNQLNRFENQSRMVWTQNVVSTVDFSGLSPGQNYCAVANFSFPTFSIAASPKSSPQCVETVSKSGKLSLMCLGIGLTSLFLLLFLIVFLQKLRNAAPKTSENPAKTLPTVSNLVSSVPIDPCDIHLDFGNEPVPINSSSSLHFVQDLTLTPGNRSSSDSVCCDLSTGVVYWDSGGLDSGIGTSIPLV